MKEQINKEKEKVLIFIFTYKLLLYILLQVFNEMQQRADMEKMQSEARHLQELSARKALEEKMSKVMKPH